MQSPYSDEERARIIAHLESLKIPIRSRWDVFWDSSGGAVVAFLFYTCAGVLAVWMLMGLGVGLTLGIGCGVAAGRVLTSNKADLPIPISETTRFLSAFAVGVITIFAFNYWYNNFSPLVACRDKCDELEQVWNSGDHKRAIDLLQDLAENIQPWDSHWGSDRE